MIKTFFISVTKFYKAAISPFLQEIFGGGCRYTPTCSNYFLQAIDRYGVVKGLILATRRLSRCHPFYKSESYFDPLPDLYN